jgi:CBS domain-containing protein
MRCEDVMTRGNLERCYVWEDVSLAAARMRFRDVGFLPVLDDRGRVVGIVTDRDLTTRVLADGLAYDETRVSAVMSRGIVYCHPWEDLATVEGRMMSYGKSRIVCLDAYGRLLGIISLSNLAKRDVAWRSGNVLRSVAGREARPH